MRITKTDLLDKEAILSYIGSRIFRYIKLMLDFSYRQHQKLDLEHTRKVDSASE